MIEMGSFEHNNERHCLTIQKIHLNATGCEIVHVEMVPKTFAAHRAELTKVPDCMCEGDESAASHLDRLWHCTVDALNLYHKLNADRASRVGLETKVTTTGTAAPRPTVMRALRTDIDVKVTRDPQYTGLEAAMDQGVYKGRRKSIPDDEVQRFMKLHLPKADLMRDLERSRMTVCGALPDLAARRQRDDAMASGL